MIAARTISIPTCIGIAIAALLGCGSPLHTPASETPDVFATDSILSSMKRSFQWQLAHIVSEAPLPDGGFQEVSDTEWVRGAFFAGVIAAFEATGDSDYWDAAKELSLRNTWQPGPRPRHADDHCIAQTYTKIFLIERDPDMIAATVSRFDEMIADPRPGPSAGWTENDNWSWCDALFMAPPTMTLIAEATGERKYLDLMDAMWWDTHSYLYDSEEALWYRDGKYTVQKDGSQVLTTNGHKVFWSRGNGWVFAGLALVLEHMPNDYPSRPRYEELYRNMAKTLIRTQGEDGLWRSSLLDPDEFPIPESSGTGFFTFGLAWGVNNGLLDRDLALPAVHKGWQGLNWALQSSGKLGWVQQIGYDPRSVTADDNMEYGTGAFLLAGGEMLRLADQFDSPSLEE
ncbi:MAG: glycoside hydrolase family 88 protein [bacterium]|nr:glycoside hydrolase family 88 protein [bacterium]